MGTRYSRTTMCSIQHGPLYITSLVDFSQIDYSSRLLTLDSYSGALRTHCTVAKSPQCGATRQQYISQDCEGNPVTPYHNSHCVQEMVQISGHNDGRKSTVSGSTGVRVRPQGKWWTMCIDHAECQLDGNQKELIDRSSLTFQTFCHHRHRQ